MQERNSCNCWLPWRILLSSIRTLFSNATYYTHVKASTSSWWARLIQGICCSFEWDYKWTYI